MDHQSDREEFPGGVGRSGGAARSGSGGGSDDARLAESVAVLRDACDVLADLNPAELTDAGLGEVLLDLLTVKRQVDGAVATVADRFAHGNAWAADGARDAIGWVRGRTQDGFGSARRVFTTGNEARVFEVMGDALRRGEVSVKHVNELGDAARKFPRLHRQLHCAQQQIVELARESEPGVFGKWLTALCHRLDPVAAREDERSRDKEFYLRASTVLDGCVRVDGMLPAEVGQLLIAALEAARRQVKDSDAPEHDGSGGAAGDGSGGVSGGSGGPDDATGGGGGGGDSDIEPELDIFGNPIKPPHLDPIDSRLMGGRNVEALHRTLTLATVRTGGDTNSTNSADSADSDGSVTLASVAGSRPTINVTVSVETLTAERDETGWTVAGWSVSAYQASRSPPTPHAGWPATPPCGRY